MRAVRVSTQAIVGPPMLEAQRLAQKITSQNIIGLQQQKECTDRRKEKSAGLMVSPAAFYPLPDCPLKVMTK
ncbi:unnamed protein product [Caretta caretta]